LPEAVRVVTPIREANRSTVVRLSPTDKELENAESPVVPMPLLITLSPPEIVAPVTPTPPAKYWAARKVLVLPTFRIKATVPPTDSLVSEASPASDTKGAATLEAAVSRPVESTVKVVMEVPTP
jgi:hypothetical protein